jgi:tRNA (mo5U34)-methyltransferase
MQDEIASTSWYHTIELPGGGATPGIYDLRGTLRSIPFPASLEGKRCLDVGTADGFWAFEMERRKAREVVAIDVVDASRRDFPWMPEARPKETLTGRRSAFSVAHRALGSSVEHRDLSAYEITPESLGRFDFIFLGDLLIHLRDPVRCLAGASSVLTDNGELLLNEAISMSLTLAHPSKPVALLEATARPRWWFPNAQAVRRMVIAGGLEILESGRPYGVRPLPPRDATKQRRRSLRARVMERRIRTYGIPHVWVRTRRAR